MNLLEQFMPHRLLTVVTIAAMLSGVSACSSKEEKRIARISEPNVVVPEAEFTSQEVTRLFLDVCVDNLGSSDFVQNEGAKLQLKRRKTPSPDYYHATRRAKDGGQVKLSYGESTVHWDSVDDAGEYGVFNCIVAANVKDAFSPMSDEIYEILARQPLFSADPERWEERRTMAAYWMGKDGVLRVRLPFINYGSSELCKGIPDCGYVGVLEFWLEFRI